MADAHANFAYSTVATAPVPAASGTSLVVAAGQGALFPAVPFNVTVWPAGVLPLASNAEIVRVTNIAVDTLTITRTQEGSSARTIVVGDQIAATVTAKTLSDVEAEPIAAAHIADAGDAHDASAISSVAAGNLAATDVQAALDELDSEKAAVAEPIAAAHISDVSAAHAASAVSADSTTLVGVGTDVQAVLEELDNGIADHLADATDAHAGTAITNTPAGSIAAITVQAAINELDTEKQPVDADLTTIAGLAPANDDVVQRKAGVWANRTLAQLLTDLNLDATYATDAALASHEADTTAVHGVADMAALLTATTGIEVADYDPNTVLAADSDNTPTARTITEEQVVGRITGGVIAGINPSSVVQIINTQTANYIFALADAGKIVEMNLGVAGTLTVPPNSDVALPVGTRIDVVQYGAGAITLTPGIGVTLRVNALLTLVTHGTYSGCTLYKRGTNEWVCVGDLVPV